MHFDQVAWLAIREYHLQRNAFLGKAAPLKAPVFARHDRRAMASPELLPLTTHMVRTLFRELSAQGHIEEWVHPHSLRHTFATQVYEATSDIAVVQKMLGHKHLETTKIYTEVSDKRVEDAYRKTFGE